MKNGETLLELFDNAMLTGEVPYQANRRVLRVFDVLEDVDAGNKELEVLLNGIGEFTRDLQEVENVARNVAKHVASFL